VRLPHIVSVFKSAGKNWVDDYAPSMGAALSYYTVFSMSPLLIIVIAIAALVFGEHAAQSELLNQIRTLLGDQGAKAIELMLEHAQKPKEGSIAGVISVVTLIIGATGVFNELETDLNRVFKTQGPEVSGIWHLLRARLLSFGMVLAIAFLLIVSLVVSAALAAWGTYWSGLFGGVEALLHAVNFIVSLIVLTLLFAVMYKVLPSLKLAWRHVWLGAAVTSLLFTMGKLLIGLYIGKSSVASGYGAAGTLVVLLLWVYYSAQIFLFGAEFIRAYAGGGNGARFSQKSPPF
jgi:membrane protein